MEAIRSCNRPPPACHRRGERHFDAIVYGDEPAGVMTALELRRRLVQLAGIRRPRIALVTDADIGPGLGGTVVRSVRKGAAVACAGVHQLPEAIHLIVVDPGAEFQGDFADVTAPYGTALLPTDARATVPRANG